MKLDYKVSKFLNDKNNNTLNITYNTISILSSIIMCVIIIILYDKTPKKIFFKTFIICFSVMIFFKRYMKRKRPYLRHDDITNNDILPTNKYYSFPSSHVMSSIIISLLITKQLKIKYFFPIFPIFVIISRIGLGVHYLTDCIFSFLFTYIINFIFYL
jgi:membrane-associated phospholipid phosphatase